MVAGGSLSPLMGGLYLKHLDQQMGEDKRIVYVRYMDDFVVLAATRWHLKKAIAQIYRITTDLKLRLHRKSKGDVPCAVEIQRRLGSRLRDHR